MGCGDWNDGMNLVGEHGKGESVWLAFFLYDVLMQFADLARPRRTKPSRPVRGRSRTSSAQNIEEHAWDGDWYLPRLLRQWQAAGLGDQSRMPDRFPAAKLVGAFRAADPERSRQAMAALDRRLVRRDIGVIQLFDPPFDKSDLNPGYVKGMCRECAKTAASTRTPPSGR